MSDKLGQHPDIMWEKPWYVLHSFEIMTLLVAPCLWKVPLYLQMLFGRTGAKTIFKYCAIKLRIEAVTGINDGGGCVPRETLWASKAQCLLTVRYNMHDSRHTVPLFHINSQNHITYRKCFEKGCKNKQSLPVKSLDDLVPKYVLWLPVPFDATPQLHSNGPSLPRHCLGFGMFKDTRGI